MLEYLFFFKGVRILEVRFSELGEKSQAIIIFGNFLNKLQ